MIFCVGDRVKVNENYYMHFDDPNRTLWGDCVVIHPYWDNSITVQNQEGKLGSFFPEELDLIYDTKSDFGKDYYDYLFDNSFV